MKFKEGEEYNFNVLRIVEIPEEGTFYLLHHLSGRRLLLPYETYKKYSIEIGSYLECRIDKVNCTGKVFLEPKHPIYRDGYKYNFRIIKDNTFEVGFIVVMDCLNNEIKVEIPKNVELVNKQDVELTVARVKKGVPILYFQNKNQNRHKKLIGKSLPFKVVTITKNNYGEEVYIIYNESVPQVELKVKHYRSYGLSIGQLIEATMLGIKEDGSLKVEPKNPFYEIGKEYEFGIAAFEKSELNSNPIIIVEDNMGSRIGIPLTIDQFNAINNKTRLLCRVKSFRKGKPMLTICNI
jgi:hypothetical protein